MKQMLKIISILILMPMMVLPRFHVVHSHKDFDRLLDQYEYSVVCFAIKYAAVDKKEVKAQFDKLQNRMLAASKREKFHDFLSKDIGFLMVDASLEKNQSLIKELGLKKFPVMMVFDQSMMRRMWNKEPKSASDVLKMLQSEFGSAINNLAEDRKADAIERHQEQVENYYQYLGYPNTWYPYPYPSYPYSKWGVYPYFVGWGFNEF